MIIEFSFQSVLPSHEIIDISSESDDNHVVGVKQEAAIKQQSMVNKSIIIIIVSMCLI